MSERFQNHPPTTGGFFIARSMQRNTRIEIATGFAIIAALLFTAGIYWPGLNGQFILDDYPNLDRLALINGSEWFTQFFLFTFDGISGKLGRPISLFTFALQAHNWPLNPWAFKYVNLLLHLLNGCLLALLLHCLTSRLMNMPRRVAARLTVLSVGLWLLHPIQVNTVLYVVQRMTELSALFTLAGLIIYLHGRERCLRQATRSGIIWMSAAVICGGILATFSKENGILLVAYILVLEATLLHDLRKPPFWLLWKSTFLYLPLLALFAYFLFNLDRAVLSTYSIREFSIAERLLTETRVLWDYIGAIVLPRPSAYSLFRDNYPLSTTIFDPPQTLLAILSLFCLLLAAFFSRRRAPVFSFGVFWFFTGHLLESTFIGLEIYFEHRNYLPSLGIIFFAVYCALYLIEYINRQDLKRFAMILGLFWLTFSPVITWGEAKLWENSAYQAIAWLQENPTSKRARQLVTGIYFEHGHYQKVVEILKTISRDWPSDSGSHIQLLMMRCLNPNLGIPESQETLDHLKISAFDRGAIKTLRTITELKKRQACPALSYSYLVSLVQTLTNNPNFSAQRVNLYVILGNLHAAEKHLTPAIDALNKAYKLNPDPLVDMIIAQWLSSAGLHAEALSYVERAHEAAKSNPLKYSLLKEVLNSWEKSIQASATSHE